MLRLIQKQFSAVLILITFLCTHYQLSAKGTVGMFSNGKGIEFRHAAALIENNPFFVGYLTGKVNCESNYQVPIGQVARDQKHVSFNGHGAPFYPRNGEESVTVYLFNTPQKGAGSRSKGSLHAIRGVSFSVDSMKLSFGSSIPKNRFLKEGISGMRYGIYKDDLLIDSGKEEELYEFKFNTPGIYKVKFNLSSHLHKSDECSHPVIPEVLIVNVGKAKIKYEVDQLVFHSEISAGRLISDIRISIPVKVETYNDELHLIPNSFVVSGVDAEMTGKLILDNYMIGTGSYILQYSLSGTLKRGSYVSFDFVDFDQQVQPFYVPFEIK